MDDKRSYIKEHKKLTRIFPILFFCAFLVIAIVTIKAATTKDSTAKVGSELDAQQGEENSTSMEDKPGLFVIKEINNTYKTMVLLNVENGEELELTFSGGTEIYDKYNQVISVTQLTLGEVVDASYNTGNGKLSKLQISNQAWEYKGVSNWSIDTTNKVFNIADTKYQYSKNIVTISQGQLAELLELNEEDELTVKGKEHQIYSIIVTKGHGTIHFKSYEDFIGGTAYIGNRKILTITPGMSVIVQEGSYSVTFENGELTGTKHAVVGANQKITVNMGEFKKAPAKNGSITFTISPKGAELYIDGELQSYEEPFKLEYGIHSVKVTLGGYTTYTGDLEVDKASQSYSIGLVEAQNTTEETVIKDNTNGNSQNTGQTAGTGTTGQSSQTGTTEETGEEKAGNDTNTKDEATGNYVNILQPTGASVYLEGSNYKGEVPVSFPKTVGTYHITLIKSGYVTATYTVEFLDDGKDVTLRYDDMVKMQ